VVLVGGCWEPVEVQDRVGSLEEVSQQGDVEYSVGAVNVVLVGTLTALFTLLLSLEWAG
jgi:hypothetical protein